MTPPINELAKQHIAKLRAYFEAAPEPTRLASSYRRMLARHISRMLQPESRVLEIGCGGGHLLALLGVTRLTGVDISPRQLAEARRRLPQARFLEQAGEELDTGEIYDVILLSDTINCVADLQAVLERARAHSHPGTRLVLNFHSNLWRPAMSLGRRFGLSHPPPHGSWFASGDVRNMLELAGWDLVNHEHRILCPLSLFGLGDFINRWFAPLLPFACLTDLMVARPVVSGPRRDLRVSVVIPARNEAGNIEAAVRRTPHMGAGTELIFIEGNSSDDTWARIQAVKAAHPERDITILQQSGRGKGNAVREAFAVAKGDILMILDADLTMPPEELPKFYEIIASGRAEFANGVRLVYPMEGQAMQFLNLCANKTFGVLFTWMLGQHLKDTLCGTKVLSRAHYQAIAANRAYFGDFDPFGDFDLLFGAGRLNLKLSDVPIRYRERTYGSTNIQRWSHGWLLLRMVLFAARKLKFV